MEESKPITSLPKLYLGVILVLPGVFFMTQDESWLAIVSNILGSGLLEYPILKILIEFVPLMMFIGGLALMLKAREKKKNEVLS